MSRESRVSRRRDDVERWLDLYYDGELKGLRRWWMERLLRRNPGLRRELAVRDQLGTLIREAAGAKETPDLWAAIAGQVSAHPPPLGEGRPSPANEAEPADVLGRHSPTAGRGGWWSSGLALLPAPARLGPALAGVAAVTFFYAVPMEWTPTPGGGSVAADSRGVVRSISSQGRPVVVLEGSDDATIIWLMDGEAEVEDEQAVADGVQV